MRYLDLYKHKLAVGATAPGTHNARVEVMCPVIFPEAMVFPHSNSFCKGGVSDEALHSSVNGF
jgi:hypothetical protein